jgi:hypothetical protein
MLIIIIMTLLLPLWGAAVGGMVRYEMDVVTDVNGETYILVKLHLR